jgi:4-amino-4-deoxy-L-arabinose transferase-like glycosyltransferase
LLPAATGALRPTARDRSGLAAAAIVLVTCGFHLWFAGLFPLAPQEAYYWSWSRHLDLSYFDHPPLAAWTIRAMTEAFGSSERAIRAAAALHSAVFAAFLFLAARRLFGPRAALLAIAGATAVPLFSLGQVIVTPDGPLLSGWAMALYFTLRALGTDERRSSRMRLDQGEWGDRGGATAEPERPSDTGDPRWLLATGAAVGWALLGKYTAALLLPQVLVLLLLDPRGRRMLRTPWPWLGVLLAAAIFSPVVVWNVQHRFASFAFQTEGRVRHSGLRPVLVGRFLALQAGAVTPILLVLALDAVLVAWRRRAEAAWRTVLLFSTPLLVLAVAISPFHWVKMNWLAAAYPTAFAGAAALVLEARGWRRTVAPWGVVLGAVVTVYLHLVSVFPWVPFPARDELSSGWKDLAARVQDERAASPAGTVVIACGYKAAAELSYYLPDRPETQMKGVFGGVGLQYDVWLDWSRLAGREAIVVNDARERGCERRAEVCTAIEALPPLTPLRGGKRITTFELFRCRLPAAPPPFVAGAR